MLNKEQIQYLLLGEKINYFPGIKFSNILNMKQIKQCREEFIDLKIMENDGSLTKRGNVIKKVLTEYSNSGKIIKISENLLFSKNYDNQFIICQKIKNLYQFNISDINEIEFRLKNLLKTSEIKEMKKDKEEILSNNKMQFLIRKIEENKKIIYFKMDLKKKNFDSGIFYIENNKLNHLDIKSKTMVELTEESLNIKIKKIINFEKEKNE